MGNILGNDSGRQPRIFEPYGKEDLKADLSVAQAQLKKVRGKAQTDEQIRDIQVLESVINDIDPKNMFAVVDGTTFEGPDEIKQLMENLFEELRIMLANQELNTWVKKSLWDSEEQRSIKRWVNTAVSGSSLTTNKMREWIKEILKIPTDKIENPAVRKMMEREDKNARREYLDYRSQVGGL